MKILHWFVGGWVSRIYLALVAAVFAYELWYLLNWDGPTMAGVVSVLLTAPSSWLLHTWLAGLGGGLWWWGGLVLVSALLNIAVVKGIRALSRLRRPPAGLAAEVR
jgi:hypothetical protein